MGLARAKAGAACHLERPLLALPEAVKCGKTAKFASWEWLGNFKRPRNIPYNLLDDQEHRGKPSRGSIG
jgi:hypothetical protein